MKTELILVGKTTNKHFVACINDYVERIGHYMPFSITTIPELKNAKSLHGSQMRSIEFASWLQKMQNSARRLVFVIGGPYGFSPALYQRANQKISLSPMTFSHQMVRLVFTEQIYRACTILKGEPYHHE